MIEKAIAVGCEQWGTAEMIKEEGEISIYIADGSQVTKANIYKFGKSKHGVETVSRNVQFRFVLGGSISISKR